MLSCRPSMQRIVMAGALTCAALCLLWAGAHARETQAAPAPAGEMAVRGTVDVDGRSRGFTYHFDHNALAAAVRVDEWLIALTASGNLLRFDARMLTVAAQAVVPGRATAISVEDGHRVMLGTEDGQIASVDPVTLDRTVLARSEGSVQWLARTGDRVVAALKPAVVEPWPGEPFDAFDRATESARWLVFVRRGGTSSRPAC